ncbi:MAG TPA: glycosyltransferase family A protein [Myxococcaceae bacterium]|nr:glycosyltransferase family A protein [Myxococcaceae bacterium]
MAAELSVVIPTYNRRARLARVLDGFKGQSVDAGEFEVVLVDDGSTDGTSEWLAAQRFPFRLHVVRQANGGPAAARNAGIRIAQGRILLFIDDDLVPNPDLIAEHLHMHRMESGIAVIGPLESLPHYAQPWVAWEQAMVEAQYRAMKRGDWAPTFRQFWTANASVERERVLEVGGFDPAFLRAEDVELGVRLSLRGVRFRFNPAASGIHHAERSLKSWSSVHRAYGKLEFSIFRNLGEETAISLLAANWSGLHPATRWLISACLDRPRATSAAAAVLGACIRGAGLIHYGAMGLAACGALANLLYWEAAARELGPTRMVTIMRRTNVTCQKPRSLAS